MNHPSQSIVAYWSAILVPAFLGATSAWIPPAAAQMAYPPAQKLPEQYIFHNDNRLVQLGCERKGVRVVVDSVAPSSYLEASRERVVLIRGGKKRVIWELGDLRGSVRINSTRTALRYVRFRTTPKTFYFWPDEQVEILSRADLARLPYYGVESHWHFRPPGGGWLGVVSAKAYRQGKFTPARVHHVRGGFIITRWILGWVERKHYPEEARPLLVREFVGQDGEYKQTVLKLPPVIKLAGTKWQMADDREEE